MLRQKQVKFDVLRFVKKHVKDYHIISNGKEISLDCKWCSPKDRKKKLTINSSSGLFHCWSCNEKGNFNKFYKEYAKRVISIGEFITEQHTVFTPTIRSESNEIPYPDNFRFLTDSKKSLGAKKYFNYLVDRGITEEDINYYRLGYCTEGKYADRVIIPVYKKDTFVSFIARAITPDKKPKVLTPASLPGTHGVKDYVYNLDRAKDTKLLLIGEGVFDAIALGVSGICLFGKESSPAQLAQIINTKPRRVVICLDGDAYKYALKLADQLIFHISDVRVCSFPKEEDPSSLGPFVQDYIKSAIRFEGALDMSEF